MTPIAATYAIIRGAARRKAERMRLCCCIPDQNKLDEGCPNVAEYTIYFGYGPGPDDWTESCLEHIPLMLDDSRRFEIIEIPEEERL